MEASKATRWSDPPAPAPPANGSVKTKAHPLYVTLMGLQGLGLGGLLLLGWNFRGETTMTKAITEHNSTQIRDLAASVNKINDSVTGLLTLAGVAEAQREAMQRQLDAIQRDRP